MLQNLINLYRAFTKSKTLVIALLTFVVGLVGYLQGDAFIQEYPKLVAGLVMAKAALDSILRFATKLPVLEKRSLFSNQPVPPPRRVFR